MKTLILFILCFWLLPALLALSQVDGRIDRRPVMEVIDRFRNDLVKEMVEDDLTMEEIEESSLERLYNLNERIQEQDDYDPDLDDDYEDEQDGNPQ